MNLGNKISPTIPRHAEWALASQAEDTGCSLTNVPLGRYARSNSTVSPAAEMVRKHLYMVHENNSIVKTLQPVMSISMSHSNDRRVTK